MLSKFYWQGQSALKITDLQHIYDKRKRLFGRQLSLNYLRLVCGMPSNAHLQERSTLKISVRQHIHPKKLFVSELL